jgi:hypothetical protein
MNPSKKNLSLLIVSFCLVLLASATKARADDLFTGLVGNGMCCFNVDLQKISSTGTVLSDGASTDYMKVTVTLTDGAQYFVNTGSANHPGFAFSLSGDPTIKITNIDSPWTDAANGGTGGDVNLSSVTTNTGATFDYYIDNPGSGASGKDAGPLTFDIYDASGIGYSSFVKSTGSGGGTYFEADIMQAAGATGLSFLGSPGIQAVTPEPSSLLLLGTGIVGLAGVLRWRMRPAVNRA